MSEERYEYWVIRWRDEGECCDHWRTDYGFSYSRSDARQFATRDAARAACLIGKIVHVRGVRRRAKR